jgi:hypothetical protein
MGSLIRLTWCLQSSAAARVQSIDYKREDRSNVGELKGDIGVNRISFDFLFQKTTIIASKKRTIQPRDALEDTAFKPGFENFIF